MDIFNNIVLGVVQGITEFFPISSSGHLLIFKNLLGINDVGIYREVFLHGGTLLSILIYYKNDIKNEIENSLNGNLQYMYSLIIATIPAAIIGLLYKDVIEEKFLNSNEVSFYLVLCFLFTSFVLLLTRFSNKGEIENISYKVALFVGFIQIMALFPGISRSGMTISMALFCGIGFRHAAKFSFMMAIPIISFAFLQSIFIYKDQLLNNFIPMFFGFIISAITGYYVILGLENIMRNKKMWLFSVYCFIISIIIIINNLGVWNIL